MVIIADINSGTYKLVLVLHILAAMVGFGGVFLNSLYGQQAKARTGREGLAIAQANYLVSNVAEFFIYAVFVFGVLLVLLSDDAWTFGQFWILGVDGAVHHRPRLGARCAAPERPAHEPVDGGARRDGLTTDGRVARRTAAPGDPELEERGQRVGLAGTALNVLVVLILFLMVWKPGS